MNPAVVWFPRSAALGAGVAVAALICTLIVRATGPKLGNCIVSGTWADHWIGTLGSVGILAGGVAVVAGLMGTIAPGHRAFSVGMALFGVGAGFCCLLVGIGNAICEY
jgi:hypothetical protein